MKPWSRRLLVLAGSLLGVVASGFGAFLIWLNVTTVSASELPPLKAGDIVFQISDSSQSLAISLATRSFFSHTGIIEIDASGAPHVVEAVGPVRTVALDRWIKEGVGGRIAVMRIKDLSADAAQTALRAAHRYDGRPYDIFFLDGTEEIYCSELVRLAFLEGPQIALGRVQKAGELSLDNAAVRRLAEQRWQRYPLCQPSSDFTFEACFARMLDQPLVTPVSIAEDPKLELVYSNFGIVPHASP